MRGGQFYRMLDASWRAEEAIMQARLGLHQSQIEKAGERLDRIEAQFRRIA